MEWHIRRIRTLDRQGDEFPVDVYRRLVMPPEVAPARTALVTHLRLDGRQLDYLGRGTYLHIDDWGQRIVLRAVEPDAP